MPTVTLNKKVLEKLIGKKLPPEELKERISYLGTDLEKIEGDDIHVEIFPDRPDLLSEQGLARALSSFIGVKTGLKKYDIKKSDYKVIIEKSVQEVRPYTACAIVKNLKLNEERLREIIQIQEKLHVTFGRNRKKVAIGIYPLDKIKMPITYCAKKPQDIAFIPLDESKEMTATQILTDHPKGKEFAHLLDNQKVYPLFLDANNNVLSMPPIINSESVGKVTYDTTDVFVECSGSKLDTLQKAIRMLTAAFADMGADIYEMTLEYPDQKITTPDMSPTKMPIDIAYINKWLGIDLSEKEIQKYLEHMGHGYEKGNALIPSYRTDIMHQVDIAKDIAVAYGYENFKGELSNISTVGKLSKQSIISDKIAQLLTGLNLLEVSTYHISNTNDETLHMQREEDVVELKNALTVEYSSMRANMLPSLINVFVNNKQYEYPQKIFEIGKVFSNDKTQETGVKETNKLCIALIGKKENYTSIKQILEYISKLIDINLEVTPKDDSSYIKGRCGSILLDKKPIGVIGEVHPAVITNFALEYPIAALELDIDKIIDQC